MENKVTDFLPLSPASLHILIALAGEDRHGYGIMLEVARGTREAIRLAPGTLYRSIKRLLADGREANPVSVHAPIMPNLPVSPTCIRAGVESPRKRIATLRGLVTPIAWFGNAEWTLPGFW